MLSKGQLWRIPRSKVQVANRLRLYAADSGKQPDEAQQSEGQYSMDKTLQSSNFFSAGVKSTIGTVMQKAKEAVGMEKPLGKEGAGSMEPAGMMENKSGEGSRAERYTDLIGAQKKKSDELTKGAKVEALYSEAKPTAAANAKPGNDQAFQHDKK